MSEKAINHKLIITVVAPAGYVDRFSLESELASDLEPAYVEVNGLTYERYGDEADYIEARFDYIVKRERITEEDNPPTSDDEDEDLRRQLSEPGEPPPEMQAPRAPSPREAVV